MNRWVAVVVMLATASVGIHRDVPPPARSNVPEDCVSVVLPTVEGMPGNAVEVASGIRDLMVSYLGPSTRAVALDAKLPSQAIDEAKQKGCEPLLFTTVTKKSGTGRLTKAVGQAAGNSAWYLPGGGSVAGTAARVAAAGALQAVSSVAASTKAKDEVRLEYRLQSAGGQIQFGPKSEAKKASADGEDILTPLVMRAAEAIVTRRGDR